MFLMAMESPLQHKYRDVENYSCFQDIKPKSRKAADATNWAITNPARCPSSQRLMASSRKPPEIVKYHQANMRVRSGFFNGVTCPNPMKPYAFPCCEAPRDL